MLVLRDANLERAANAAVFGSMLNSGQVCIAVERVYVEAEVYDEFVAKVVDKVRRLRQGPPGGPGTIEVGAITLPVSETSVSYARTLPATPLADWEAEATGLDRTRPYVRRESERFVSPALHVQTWEIEAGDDQIYENVRVQAITPESPDTTHLFLRGAHGYATDRAVVTQHLQQMIDGLAARDVDLLETIHERAGFDGWNEGVRVRADRAALRARAIVGEMLANEAGRQPRSP